MRFSVAEDGTVSNVETKEQLPQDVASPIVAWLASCRFEPARDPSGAPARVRASQTIRFVDPPWPADGARGSRPLRCVVEGDVRTEPPPREADALPGSWTKPKVDAACVPRSVRLPRLDVPIGGPLTVKFAVLAGGRVAGFRVLTNGVPDNLACAIWTAIQSCTWTPAVDPEGRPASVWVTMPLRFH